METFLPPGPRAPAFVQMYRWARRPVQELSTCHRLYGDTFTLRLPGTRALVVVSHPEDVKAVFTRCSEIGPTQSRLVQPVLGSNSVLGANGGVHARNRRLLIPPFHGERMRVYAEAIQEAADRATRQWEPGAVVSIEQTMLEISLDLILRLIFGMEQTDPKVMRTIREFVDVSQSFWGFFPSVGRKDLGPGSPGRRFLRIRNAVNDFITECIAKRRKDPGDDILSLLLATRDEDGQPLSDQELRDQLFTLIVTGHDSTGSSLSWAYRWLLSTPSAANTLDDVLAQMSPSTSPREIARIPYVKAVCQEALRLVPVVISCTRHAREPLPLRNYTIPAGCSVMPAVYLTHRRPDVFEDPTVFRPERFIERKFSQFEYYPFGARSRRCVGSAFAMYEISIVLARLWPRFRLEAIERDPPFRRRGIVSWPGDDYRVKVLERCAPMRCAA